MTDPAQQRYILASLRSARAAALGDAEGFSEVLFAIERLGTILSGKVGTLADYRVALKGVATCSPLATDLNPLQRQCHPDFESLFDVVRKSRNDALHHGAFARHLTRHAVELCLLLEDGLMTNATIVADFMVRDPLCAEPWQPLSLIRQQMLANSFSYLPILGKNGSWGLVADFAVARAIARDLAGEGRKKALASTLENAVAQHGLEVLDVAILAPGDTIQSALNKCEGKPLLVVDADSHLVGILTSFDLL